MVLKAGFYEPLCLAGRLQIGYVTDRVCPEAPRGPETMDKRNGLMASVLVTSPTPQVQRLQGLGLWRGRAGGSFQPTQAQPGQSWTARLQDPMNASI